jgi:hypothetical protein
VSVLAQSQIFSFAHSSSSFIILLTLGQLISLALSQEALADGIDQGVLIVKACPSDVNKPVSKDVLPDLLTNFQRDTEERRRSCILEDTESC